MSFIEDSLTPGETILHRARVSWWSQLGWLLIGVVTLVAVIGLAFLIAAWMRVRSTEIAITSQRVIARFGLVTSSTVEISLDRVEALRIEQGFLGRMLNYGTMYISGAGIAVAPIPDIADPLVFRRKLMEATNRAMTMPRQ